MSRGLILASRDTASDAQFDTSDAQFDTSDAQFDINLIELDINLPEILTTLCSEILTIITTHHNKQKEYQVLNTN